MKSYTTRSYRKNKILIPKIEEKIRKKLKELHLLPGITPKAFLKKYRKHRYFSFCKNIKGEKVIFYARLHKSLEAKEKFIREINFLRKIEKSKLKIKENIPRILNYGIEKDFEWLIREDIKANVLGRKEISTFPLSERNLKELIECIIEISKIRPKKLTLKLEKFNTKNYLSVEAYQGLVKRGLISKDFSQKILRLIKKNYPLLLKENHYFCHGDLNLGNILVERSKVWIIDWELIHLNNFAYDISYLWSHLWKAKKIFRNKLINCYLKNLSNSQIKKFQKIFPLVISYFALGGIEYKEKGETAKIFEKRKNFYLNLLKRCLDFKKLIQI